MDNSKYSAKDRISRKFLIKRRHFLSSIGAGAALTAAWPTMGFFAAESEEWDVIVVGGGTAGLPAALFSAMRGGRVLIIDAAPALGGTLFMSGGLMSAAGTKLQQAHGIKDTPESHYADISAISGGTADPDIVELAVFNAADTLNWLMDHGLDVPDEFPSFGPDAYSAARYAGGRDGGMSILRVFQEQLQRYIDDGTVRVVLNTEVTQLIQDGRGRVVGVEVRSEGEDGAASTRFIGRNVALTSGGYAANSTMVKELEGITDYAHNSYAYCQGAGITLGLKAGGFQRGGAKYIPMLGWVLKDDSYPSLPVARTRIQPDGRPSWEIYVNVHGDRFVREDHELFTTMERALAEQPGQIYWTVFDDAILRDAPPVLGGVMDGRGNTGGEWTVERMLDAFDKGKPHFYKADSVEELAKSAGIRHKELARTVKQYNHAQREGSGDAFNRRYMPRSIARAPYYAIKSHGTNVLSFAGLAVDNSLRVVRKGGAPIEGLFAAGEVLGTGQLMGRGYCGGMMVTPAVTFGRLLGQRFFKM